MLLTASETLNVLSRLVRKKKVMYRLQFVTQQVNSIQTKSSLKWLSNLKKWVQTQSVSRIWQVFLRPYVTYDLVKMMKEEVKIPIQLHTHYTSGEASMVYLKAIEAGVDVIDCAMSPLAMGTSQPPTEPMVAALQGTEYDTGYDLDKLIEICDYFKPLREEYIKSGLMNTKVMGVDVNTLKYQVPGGMLSNLVSQLKQQGREDAYDEVLKEVPRVRADFGYPPLVTPSSQIVGTQAVLNVLMGERYKMVSKESKGLVRGEYGKCPAEISDEIVKEDYRRRKENYLSSG